MTRRVVIFSLTFLSAGLIFTSAVSAQQPDQRDEVVRALLRHSRLLTGARIEIPAGVYHRYLRELHAPERPESDAPVPYIAESGTYHLTVGADQSADMKVKICLRVFDPRKCLNIPILGTKYVIWEDLAVDDKGAILTTLNGWIRFTAPRPGLYTITGQLRKAGATRRDVIPTVRTAAAFDSPGVWEVRVEGQAKGQVAGRLVGTSERGTHGLIALKPTNKIRIKYTKPMPKRARPPRYSLQGDVAWNLGAAAQQITASLKATIAAGASDRIVLLLPDGADRVKITGPEVRKVQVGSGRAVVHLRGKILGTTVLKVSCELPAGGGPNRRLGRFGVSDGRWSGGTLVVTNSAGGSEILPATMTGLRRMSLSEVPPSASAILPAPAVMAYEITSREFSAEVEVLRLGRFALRQSIVDLAHYEVFLARDGSVICRARYEIRNSNKQFLRLKLPAGAQVLLARVNEKSRPLSPATGKKNTWLLPLERSRASVMGLVSFPAEVVFLCRTAPMGKAGAAEIPLPGIDLPIAYAWCETYVPADLAVEKWSGVMKKVSRFSSETATASLDYGWGELAEGYTGMDRPTARPTPTPTITQPTTQPSFVASLEPVMGVPILSRIPILDRAFTNRAKVRDEDTSGFIQLPKIIVTTRSATPILARNYYRTGKDYYDKNEFAEAARYLEQVAKLAPGSAEARNAKRLLANPQMPKARELETKAEKAAARVVEREVAESNIRLEYQQKAYIQSGKAAAREGRYKEASAKLKAAQSATEQLIARGAGRKETIARMQQAQPEMKQLRKQTVAKVAELRVQMKQLEKQKKYGEALKVAGQVRQKLSQRVEGRFDLSRSTKVLQEQLTLDKKAADELRRKMDTLAAAASKQRQKDAKKLAVMREKVRRLSVRQSQVPQRTLANYPDKWSDVTLRRKPADIPTTAPARKESRPITRVYDIRDLVVRTPDFKGPKVTLRKAADNNANNNAAGWGWDDDDDDYDSELSRQKSTGDLLKLIREAIAPDTWRSGGGGGGQDRSVREQGGQIIVTGSTKKQQALTDLLDQLRQARGPQVEEGKKIAQQKAGGKTLDDVQVDFLKKATAHADRATRTGETPRITVYSGQRAYVADRDGGWHSGRWRDWKQVQIKDRELDEFIRRNYDWALKRQSLETTVTIPDGGTLLLAGQRVNVSGLVSKLRFNRGQKVVVNSLNVNADASAAAALGVRFKRGGNNLNWAVINEAQFRTLMELDAELTRRGGRTVAANDRLQETIVGTDARLSNEMIANITFAGDKGNALNISGNTINLAHEGYLLLYNGQYLTVVRAGTMQHWREKPTNVQFVEVPQNIEVPRVGQLFRFERTLLEPSDQMVLRVEYKQKGASK